MATKLKDIDEVRCEVEHKLEDVRANAKVVHAQSLVARAIPEKL